MAFFAIDLIENESFVFEKSVNYYVFGINSNKRATKFFYILIDGFFSIFFKKYMPILKLYISILIRILTKFTWAHKL